MMIYAHLRTYAFAAPPHHICWVMNWNMHGCWGSQVDDSTMKHIPKLWQSIAPYASSATKWNGAWNHIQILCFWSCQAACERILTLVWQTWLYKPPTTTPIKTTTWTPRTKTTSTLDTHQQEKQPPQPPSQQHIAMSHHEPPKLQDTSLIELRSLSKLSVTKQHGGRWHQMTHTH